MVSVGGKNKQSINCLLLKGIHSHWSTATVNAKLLKPTCNYSLKKCDFFLCHMVKKLYSH